jgi:hypothetical protein
MSLGRLIGTHRHPLCALVLVLCFLFEAEAQAATYYVRPTGNDASSGTSEQTAWRTLGRVSSADLNAGDRVLLEAGAVFAGQLRFGPEDAGTATNPVTVGSYGSGRAMIEPGDQTGLRVHNAGGYAIAGLVLRGSGRGQNAGSGIHFLNTVGGATKLEYVRIDNVDVSGFRDAGILVEGNPADGSKSGWQNVEVTNCVLHDNETSGMYVTGVYDLNATTYANRDVDVRRCRVFDNSGEPAHRDVRAGDGVVLADTDGGTIERSVAYNNGFLCGSLGGGPIGFWTWHSNDITIQYNESYANRSCAGGGDGGGLDLDGGVTNSTVQYNYTHNNDGAGVLVCNFPWAAFPNSGNVVRYNVSVNDGRAENYPGIYIYAEGTGVTNTDIYNNTVYQSPAAFGTPSAVRAERWWGSPGSIRFRNNLLITKGGVPLVEAPAGMSDLTFQGNNYWSTWDSFEIKWGNTTYGSLPGWRSATGMERLNGGDVGLSRNPRLLASGSRPTLGDPDRLPTLDAYRIRNDSPLRDAGLNLAAAFGVSVGTRDYFGASIPQYGVFDVGAHEFANPVSNDGFESGSASPWGTYGAATVATGNARRGIYAARMSGSQAGFLQTVAGLRPNTKYTVNAQLQQESSSDKLFVGVKGYGGPEEQALGNSTSYARRSVTFTTGVSNTSAVVYLRKDAGAGAAYADDVAVEPVPTP